MNVLKIGMRSIGRNKRRTLVTTLATALAGGIMIFYSSLMEGLISTLERNALSMELGEIQIHAQGYRHSPDLYNAIDSSHAIVERLEAAGYRATPRLYGFGLAAAGAASAGVHLRGYEPRQEQTVTTLHQHVREGQWIDTSDPKGVVIGGKLKKTLRVELGDEIVILSQASDGSMANDVYHVRGVLKTVNDVTDRSAIIFDMSAFRSLMGVPNGAHEIVVTRSERRNDLREAVKEVASMAPGEETLSWRELQPTLGRMIDSSQASSAIMLLITYAAIAMVVLNATLMSVFERIREFGVMKALGVTPIQVGLIILVEVMTQATLAVLLALALGVPLSHYCETHGIDLTYLGATDMSFAGIAMEPTWYARMTTSSVLMPVSVLLFMVGLAAIYPGVKAAIIQPLEAIRHH